MAVRPLMIAILLLTACSGSEPNEAPDAGLETPDGSACGESPGEICPSVACYLCANQGKENCRAVCMFHECWTCTAGQWQKTAVNCVADCTPCGTRPGPSCPSVDCEACENQTKDNCSQVCANQECWDCADGGWQRTAVDCVADCT